MRIETDDNIDHGTAQLEDCLEANILRFKDGFVLCPILWSGGSCKECMEQFDQLDEYGDIMDESEFLSREFMEDCYSLGQEDHKLYSRNFTGEYLTDEKIMLVEAIVIKAVMDYTGEENERREENN